jgi:hypothetical protein
MCMEDKLSQDQRIKLECLIQAVRSKVNYCVPNITNNTKEILVAAKAFEKYIYSGSAYTKNED